MNCVLDGRAYDLSRDAGRAYYSLCPGRGSLRIGIPRIEELHMCNKSLAVIVALAISTPAAASRIVYLAEQDKASVNELYVVDLGQPGQSLKLNKALTGASEGVGQFAISPDGSLIAFSADQDSKGDPDMYVVDIRTPGKWTKLGSLPAGQRETAPKFSPDGSKVAYTASDQSFANTELYVVDLSNPGAATRVNGNLAAGGAVSMTGFEFTPDGSHIVYVAGELEQKFELYAVDLATPGDSVRLNASGGNVGDSYEGRFRVLANSSQVVYSAVWKNPGVREVHVVSLDRPGMPATINAPFQTAGYVAEFAVSRDGRYVAYAADQETDGVNEVYLVDVNAPGSATKISGTVLGGGGSIRFTPDSRYVLFSADGARGPFERDLYTVPVDLSTSAMRLSAPLGAGDDIGQYGVSEDGSSVAYPIIPSSGFPQALMVTRIDAADSAIQVNGPLPNGTLELIPPQFSPDGTEIAFIAVDSLTDSIQELFFARTSAPGASVRVNAPMVSGGIVSPAPHSFEFLPANAPATGNAGSGGSGSGSGDSGSKGGGGSMDWLSILLLLMATRRAAARGNRRIQRADL